MPNIVPISTFKKVAKQISFYLILIAIPFLILLILELLLRWSDFGNEYPLFIEKKLGKNHGDLYLQPNPKIINRYFSNEELAPNVSPDTVYFKKDKSENSFRIFIQGGSTAAGFPYGRWGSLQGMLEQRFKRLYPKKNIEIINTAMAAVNSYTLLDFVDEIIEQQPDLVLIYAGHNEYLGIMGVGSSFAAKGGRLATMLHLKFKNLRLYQLLQKIYTLTFSPDMQLSKSNKLNKSLMSQVAKEREIVLGSDLYQQGIEQFTGNMSLILQKYQAAGVPVVIGNLVSNESGQVPFSSLENIEWKIVKDNLSKENAPLEIARLKQSLSVEKIAEDYYQLGLNLQLLGFYKEAKQAFILAKEHDLLRFRAPSQFSFIIESLAEKYGAGFVNVQTMFNENSTHGIVNNKLIIEHLHPTVEGYFLLAEAYADYVIKKNFLGLSSAYPSLSSILIDTRDEARSNIPVSKIDSLYGDFVIKKLMNDFPFTSLLNKGEKEIPLPKSGEFERQELIKRINDEDWLSIQKNLLVEYQKRKDIPEAAKIAATISTAMINNHKVSYIAGQLYQQLNDWQLASYYHHKAVQLQSDNVTYLLTLAKDYFYLQQYDKSLALLDKSDALVANSSPQKQQVLQYKANVKQAMYSKVKANNE